MGGCFDLMASEVEAEKGARVSVADKDRAAPLMSPSWILKEVLRISLSSSKSDLEDTRIREGAVEEED